ncbi:MAG TPA: NUDIX hydrolase [Ktedonobacteraceae bacterium]|nr:NUDIX hydrolase [Ktedonobacteraceae bacterium]
MVEFEIVVQGLFRPDQLVMSYDPSLRMTISPETQAWMDTYWQQKLAQAKAQGTRLFDAPLFRFVKASVQDGTLHIAIGDTSYKEYVTTRISEFAASRARHELGNALSVCSVVETSDNYILLDRREGVDVYVGRYHVIGGFFERNLDMAYGHTQPDPFAAMRREIREETGIQSDDVSEQYSLGFVYDLTTPHAEICFLTRLHIPLSEAQTRQPEDDEIKQLHTLQVTAESLRTFILHHHDNISATGEPNLLLYGAWKFGGSWYEEVMARLKHEL